MQCEKRHCSYFGVLLVANSIRCRRLHSGSDLTPSLRRLQCVTLAFLSMPTSACKYMFSSVSHGCFAIVQYPAVRSNGCVSDCGRHPRVVTVEFRQRYFGWPPTLPSQPSSDHSHCCSSVDRWSSLLGSYYRHCRPFSLASST